MIFNSPQERYDWEKTFGKEGRMRRYRELAHLGDDDEIKEINNGVFNRVCVESGCNPNLFKAELLNEDAEYWLKESL